ncbi:MAG: hypothetical protein NVSMB65_12850 [Chloroflexota bacterium]
MPRALSATAGARVAAYPPATFLAGEARRAARDGFSVALALGARHLLGGLAQRRASRRQGLEYVAGQGEDARGGNQGGRLRP